MFRANRRLPYLCLDTTASRSATEYSSFAFASIDGQKKLLNPSKSSVSLTLFSRECLLFFSKEETIHSCSLTSVYVYSVRRESESILLRTSRCLHTLFPFHTSTPSFTRLQVSINHVHKPFRVSPHHQRS